MGAKALGIGFGATASYSRTSKGYEMFSIGVQTDIGLDALIPKLDGLIKIGVTADFETFRNTIQATLLNSGSKY